MSKLIELMLAADIKWPAGANFAAQDYSGFVKFADKQPVCNPKYYQWEECWTSSRFDLGKQLDDWHTTIVTAQDYYLAGGWIEYNTGKADLVLQPGNHDILYDSGYTNLNPSDDIDFSAARCYRLIQQPGLYDIHVDPVVIEPVEPVVIGNNDHSWYGQGKLPPIGCECYYMTAHTCELVVIQGHGCVEGMEVAFYVRKDSWCTSPAEFFCPIHTEREKAIEDMARIIADHGNIVNDISLGALVDAGYHK